MFMNYTYLSFRFVHIKLNQKFRWVGCYRQQSFTAGFNASASESMNSSFKRQKGFHSLPLHHLVVQTLVHEHRRSVTLSLLQNQLAMFNFNPSDRPLVAECRLQMSDYATNLYDEQLTQSDCYIVNSSAPVGDANVAIIAVAAVVASVIVAIIVVVAFAVDV